MKERGWSIYRLAKETGLSQSTLAHIFRKDSVPTVATLEVICRSFGLSLSQFFAEDGPLRTADKSTLQDSVTSSVSSSEKAIDSRYLSKEQARLISGWSLLSSDQRELVQVMIDTMLSQNGHR
ncbi:MAG: helix-turn-helix transcriptional regulator [Clostridia bacterium]|nr:helix-turn-helix transcriptional regulator [Clostridia bacterium]